MQNVIDSKDKRISNDKAYYTQKVVDLFLNRRSKRGSVVTHDELFALIGRHKCVIGDQKTAYYYSILGSAKKRCLFVHGVSVQSKAKLGYMISTAKHNLEGAIGDVRVISRRAKKAKAQLSIQGDYNSLSEKDKQRHTVAGVQVAFVLKASSGEMGKLINSATSVSDGKINHEELVKKILGA